MFKAQDVSMKWSPSGSGVLCKTETAVDATGKSYYGESGLYLLLSRDGDGCAVETGSVYDSAWTPDGRSFIAISGTMPPKSALYDLRGREIFSFGEAHRNTVRISPNGRFACIGGFGNLAGQLDFWDLDRKVLLASVDASCSVDFGWSPCSRLFFTATTAPRMRVDNGVKVWAYSGEQVKCISYSKSELYEAAWCMQGSYDDEPVSPRVAARKAPIKTSSDGSKGEKKQVKAYRPPGARSGSSTGGRSLSQLLKSGGGGGGRGRTIPGMTPVVGGAPVGGTPVGGAAKKKKRRRGKKSKAPPAESAPAPEPAPAPAPAPVDPAKRIKALKKKLRQIGELKEKQKAGKVLEEAQLKKVSGEADIVAELAKLEM